MYKTALSYDFHQECCRAHLQSWQCFRHLTHASSHFCGTEQEDKQSSLQDHWVKDGIKQTNNPKSFSSAKDTDSPDSKSLRWVSIG